MLNLAGLAAVGYLVLSGAFGGLPDLPASLVMASRTPSPTLSATPSPSHTPTLTGTPTATPTATITPTASLTPTPSLSPTATPWPTPTPIVIGYSVEGRPLEVFPLGSGPLERLMVFGIHGGSEWNTVALADEMIESLSRNPDLIPADNTLYILRVLNPDGLARGHGSEGRANAHGVDLNRNWRAFWKPDWDRTGCTSGYPITAGDRPGSEPETMALLRFILAHKIEALIDYHSAYLGISPGGQPPSSRSISLAKALAAVSRYAYPPPDTGCEYTGQFTDWASLNGIAAVVLELNSHEDTEFDKNLPVLKALLAWRR